MICKPGAIALRLGSDQEIADLCPAYLAGLGASPGWYCKSVKPWASARRLDSDSETVAIALQLKTEIYFRPVPKFGISEWLNL